jgi:hypothetical protein
MRYRQSQRSDRTIRTVGVCHDRAQRRIFIWRLRISASPQTGEGVLPESLGTVGATCAKPLAKGGVDGYVWMLLLLSHQHHCDKEVACDQAVILHEFRVFVQQFCDGLKMIPHKI